MNYSQMKDERLLAFYENVRRQVAIDAGSRYQLCWRWRSRLRGQATRRNGEATDEVHTD